MLAREVTQGLAVEELHGQIRQSRVVDAAVDEAGEIGVVQLAHDPDFALEALDRRVVMRVPGST